MPTTIVNGDKANWGVSDGGSLMDNAGGTGLAFIEPEGTYEHLAIGTPHEGYSLIYKHSSGGADHVEYDVFGAHQGIVQISNHICRDNNDEFVKVTESQTGDGLLTIRQTFIIPKNNTRAIIRMEITNCGGRRNLDVFDFLVKRYADIDVDTGGTAGWAGFLGRWDKNRYSVFSYNLDSDAVNFPGKRSHIVNMVAMPSDLPMDDTFVGQFGGNQFNQRANVLPLVTPTNRVDAIGVLQWYATKLRVGETIRINLYYDTYRSFAGRTSPTGGPVPADDNPPLD